jgi:putative molybdopterin biosynthesis protein
MEQLLVTAQDAAKALRLNRYAVYRLARSGAIPVVRIGHRIRFRPDDLEHFIRCHRTPRARSSRNPKKGSATHN